MRRSRRGRVGTAALRRRRSVFWPAQDLVNALAGRSAQPVDYWREVAALLAPLRLDVLELRRPSRVRA